MSIVLCEFIELRMTVWQPGMLSKQFTRKSASHLILVGSLDTTDNSTRRLGWFWLTSFVPSCHRMNRIVLLYRALRVAVEPMGRGHHPVSFLLTVEDYNADETSGELYVSSPVPWSSKKQFVYIFLSYQVVSIPSRWFGGDVARMVSVQFANQ